MSFNHSFLSTPINQYLHGTSRGEQRRLSQLNTLLNEACLRQLALEGGEKVLDVGSGLGQFSRAMARAVGPRGRVVAVESNPKQLAEARRQARAASEPNLVAWRRGDALALPLRPKEWGQFDLAHARFLLEHVTRPDQVVAGMVRAVRAGGRIVLADDDHDVLRLWPELPGFTELWQAYMQTYRQLGCDPFVGRRLVELLHQAGAKPVSNHWIFFGSCAGDKAFPAFIRNVIGVIETARSAIFDCSPLSAADFNDAIRAFRGWGRRPDAALWFALCWAEGVRR